MSDDVQELNTVDDMAEVRIGLPLPMDITGTLLNVIGLTWPGAVIKNGDDPRHDRHIVVGIPGKQRHKSSKAAEKYAKCKEFLNANSDADITEMDANGVAFSWPEWLARSWVAMARQCWERFPDAKNYLQSEILDRDTNQRYVFYVAKSDKQTPHALREAAEKRLQAVRDICEKQEAETALLAEIREAVGEA